MDAPEFAWHHRDLFARVAEHNLAVMIRRRKGGSWEAAENQYRNPWQEAQNR